MFFIIIWSIYGRRICARVRRVTHVLPVHCATGGDNTRSLRRSLSVLIVCYVTWCSLCALFRSISGRCVIISLLYTIFVSLSSSLNIPLYSGPRRTLMYIVRINQKYGKRSVNFFLVFPFYCARC